MSIAASVHPMIRNLTDAELITKYQYAVSPVIRLLISRMRLLSDEAEIENLELKVVDLEEQLAAELDHHDSDRIEEEIQKRVELETEKLQKIIDELNGNH